MHCRAPFVEAHFHDDFVLFCKTFDVDLRCDITIELLPLRRFDHHRNLKIFSPLLFQKQLLLDVFFESSSQVDALSKLRAVEGVEYFVAKNILVFASFCVLSDVSFSLPSWCSEFIGDALETWVGCGTNGKLFASCVASSDVSCASLSPSDVFLRLSPWHGVDFMDVVLSPLDQGAPLTVRLHPSSSRSKAWARQLSSCKATQVAAVSYSGSVFKPRQSSPASFLEYFKCRIEAESS